MKRLIYILIALLSVSALYAQHNRTGIDPTELDFQTNITVPEVPQKQSAAIKAHMSTINDALKRLDFQTHTSRQGEVVTVTIPCSDLFAPNDITLKATGKSKLQHLSKFLKYPTMYKIIIAVYSDDTGELQYSDDLTSSRANAIDDYLIEVGQHNNFPPINAIPYGMGQSDPIVENNSIANRATNRRVEISIVPEYEMIETARAGKLNP